MGLRLPIARLLLGLVLAPLPGWSLDRDAVLQRIKAQWPNDLQVLMQQPVSGGVMTLGI